MIKLRGNKSRLIKWINCSIVFLVFFSNIFIINTYRPVSAKATSKGGGIIENIPTKSADNDNFDNIQNIFSQKLADYSLNGYFPQIYESSLQATYYALYILDAIGKLNQVNQSVVIDYIMSHFDDNSQIFMDKYAYRYLDFQKSYYPYSSVLEINCYAILSLNIFGRLDLINRQDFIDFLWSCLNPENSYNGFIGQPYNSIFDEKLRLSTMDNTYYALKTLNILMDSWEGYGNEKSRIIQFINSLQEINTYSIYFGSFTNDINKAFETLGSQFDFSLIPSYYCTKSLELFNLTESVRIDDFHQFLDKVYNEIDCSFNLRVYDYSYNLNLVGSAIGLDLSTLTNYTDINRENLIQFILSNRNENGNWDCSTIFHQHELIDTFQIIRSLEESGEIAQLTNQEKDEIANALLLYKQNDGYSLISKDYMSIELINSIVNSFALYDRITDLDISDIYDYIEGNYYYSSYFDSYSFIGCTNMNKSQFFFRSYPIEYYCWVNNNYLNESNNICNHEITYLALDSMQQIFKLDDFALEYDLMHLTNNILDSQFLEPGYKNYGAFLQLLSLKSYSPERQNEVIDFKYTYYAIKTLELLVNYLDMGNITTLNFNKAALYDYISKNIVETDSISYYQPDFTSNSDITLEYTYYMIYLLKTLNLYNLNNNKIKNFVIQNLDYLNIKNIYYSYKISEIVDIKMEFNCSSTQSLVNSLYLEDLKEFFQSLDLQNVDQDAFLWVCEMAMNSELEIECEYYDPIYLGDINTITVIFNNLIYSYFGPDISVKFESDPYGVLDLERLYQSTYQINLLVPEESQYFPYIEGNLIIYRKSKSIGETHIFFDTTIDHIIKYNVEKLDSKFVIDVNVSRIFYSSVNPVVNSILVAEIYRDGLYINSLNFSRIDFIDYTQFSLIYNYSSSGEYRFNITLMDDFYPHGLQIFSNHQTIPNPEDDSKKPFVSSSVIASLTALISISISTTTSLIANTIKKRTENRKEKETNNDEESEKKEKTAHEINEDIKKIAFKDWY